MLDRQRPGARRQRRPAGHGPRPMTSSSSSGVEANPTKRSRQWTGRPIRRPTCWASCSTATADEGTARADVAAVGRGRARPRRAAGAGGGDPSDRGPRRGRSRPRRPDPAAAGDAAARPRRHPSLGGHAVLPADATVTPVKVVAAALLAAWIVAAATGRSVVTIGPALSWAAALCGAIGISLIASPDVTVGIGDASRYASFVLFAFLVVQLTTTAAQLLTRVVRVLVLSSTGRGGDGSRRCRPARRPPGRRPDRGSERLRLPAGDRPAAGRLPGRRRAPARRMVDDRGRDHPRRRAGDAVPRRARRPRGAGPVGPRDRPHPSPARSSSSRRPRHRSWWARPCSCGGPRCRPAST